MTDFNQQEGAEMESNESIEANASKVETAASAENNALETPDDLALVKRMQQGHQQIVDEIRKVIVGQEAVVDELLIALFSGGHCLVTGVPGLAKTLLIKTVADILQVNFSRIQFTPDLMPADVVGAEIVEEKDGKRGLNFVKGPIFTNILLADEINRTPPKTQSSLLEAMEERQVTAAGVTYPMAKPFFVLATQNPIELEGTYPLPEAQLDRFMFKIELKYLSEADDVAVVANTTQTRDPGEHHGPPHNSAKLTDAISHPGDIPVLLRPLEDLVRPCTIPTRVLATTDLLTPLACAQTPDRLTDPRHAVTY